MKYIDAVLNPRKNQDQISGEKKLSPHPYNNVSKIKGYISSYNQ